MRPALALLLALFLTFPALAQQPAGDVATTDVLVGDVEAGKIKAYTCTGCHGIPGYNNVYPTYKVPKLGGQNEDYIVAALYEYREESRHHATMRAQAQSLSRQDIADVAAYFASLSEAAEHNDVDADDVPQQTQVCQACHGIAGNSIAGNYPRLAGQYADYLRHALEGYQVGRRDNAIMKGFAAELSEEDIEVLADWYSSQDGLRDLSIK